MAHLTVRGAVTDFARLSSGRLGGAVLSALWLVVAARRLSLTEVGDLALLLSLVLMGASVADGGLSWRVSEMVAADPDRGRLSMASVVRLRLALAAVVSIVVVVAFRATSSTSSWLVPLLIVPSILATAVFSTWLAGLRSVGEARVEAVIEIGSRAFMLGAGFVLLTPEAGLATAIALYSVADVLSFVVLLVVVRRRFPTAAAEAAAAPIRRRETLEMAVAVAIGVVYLRSNVWLVSALGEGVDVARYGIALRVVDAALLPSSAMAALVIPTLVGVGPDGARRALVRLGALTVAVVAIPLLFAAAAAPTLLGVVFGDEYRPAATPLRVLALAALPATIVYLSMPIVGLRDRRPLAKVFTCGLVVNLAGNLAIVPDHGAAGAAVSALVSLVAVGTALAVLALRAARSIPESANEAYPREVIGEATL